MLQFFIIALTAAVVLVNGWTDAPNAIAGVVSTNAMTYRRAVWLAAVCNLLGLLVMSLVNSSVADTIVQMADFGDDASKSLAALLSAMISVVLFAVVAWRFGIPTSESHALVAGLSGASLSLGGHLSAAAWGKVLAGLAISLVLGFLSGLFFSKTIGVALKKLPTRVLDKAQVFSAGLTAALHGAQDGQKFVAVFVVAELLAKGGHLTGSVNLRDHLLVLVLCACVMALGTSVGGKRIIDNVGSRMVTLQKHQSVCADLGGGLCLLAASLTGIPMSTTHTKTTAIMGAALSGADTRAIGEMLFAWVITFPVCGVLGFLLTRVLILVL